MLIILEGADNTGKSTLAKELARGTTFNIRHRILRKPPTEAAAFHKNDVSRQTNWILDRTYFISDLVYEPIYSGNESVFAKDREQYEKELNEKGLIVYVTCSEEELAKRYEKEGDPLYDLPSIKEAYGRYKRYFENEITVPYVRIDTSELDLDSCVQLIMNKRKEWEEKK